MACVLPSQTRPRRSAIMALVRHVGVRYLARTVAPRGGCRPDVMSSLSFGMMPSVSVKKCPVFCAKVSHLWYVCVCASIFFMPLVHTKHKVTGGPIYCKNATLVVLNIRPHPTTDITCVSLCRMSPPRLPQADRRCNDGGVIFS